MRWFKITYENGETEMVKGYTILMAVSDAKLQPEIYIFKVEKV